MQIFHLVANYKRCEEVRRVSPLQLFSLEIVEELFSLEIVEDVWLECISESPEGEYVVRFTDYVTTQLIEGRVFTPNQWNHFSNDGRRTNNNLESRHHKMNTIAEKSHPKQTYEVINIIKQE